MEDLAEMRCDRGEQAQTAAPISDEATPPPASNCHSRCFSVHLQHEHEA
jgi:hypothetical protein